MENENKIINNNQVETVKKEKKIKEKKEKKVKEEKPKKEKKPPMAAQQLRQLSKSKGVLSISIWDRSSLFWSVNENTHVDNEITFVVSEG